MGRLYDAMVMFFQEDDWKFTKLDNEPSLLLTVTGQHANYLCYAKAREQQDQFIFYALYPMKAPEEKRQSVAEYVTRANYGLVIGNFELDMGDGEVRYKTSIDVEGAQLTLSLFRSLVQANLVTADRYYPGFMALLYTSVTPAEAIAQIEH